MPPTARLLALVHRATVSPFWAWLRRWHGWLLAGLWALQQLLQLVQNQGPRHMHDSARYLYSAQQIADGWQFAGGHNLRYVGYPLFMALWLKLGTGWWGIALAQVALSGLAAWAFYATVRRLAPSPADWRPAALATVALVGWPDVQRFNWYLLTESLFISLLIFSFWALVRMRHASVGRWLLLGGALVLVGIIRPNGFIATAAAAAAGMAYLWARPGRRAFRWALAGLALLAPLSWWVLNKLLFTFTLIETYMQGNVIGGYNHWLLEPTEPLRFPPTNLAPVLRLVYFMAANPWYFGKLAVLKGLTLFFYIKSYYSWSHILLIILFIYPSYWLAWKGLRSAAWLPARTFLVAVMGLQTMMVMMTIDDWDVRFIVPLLPCVFALAGLAIARWSAEEGQAAISR
ncbi:hypothetical protein [Hymenobacter psychrophilus]|uniref:Dolichyl-phosphate-mannose-protein mannosyltransferase n=1 Tax=Hymenobacter psychrophilus TaxID=651662 RepID=A0A1H3MJU8_9BACT|nr:hypothetical protein [Hymenobacter psychrophilus]SDY76698.1 hypothetical protein SAMN04488069_11325 [Hymenobacter psychrophilus]